MMRLLPLLLAALLLASPEAHAVERLMLTPAAAAHPDEPPGEHAAAEEAADGPAHVARHLAGREEGLEVALHRLVQRRALGLAGVVGGRVWNWR
jgi:hypothetical protein